MRSTMRAAWILAASVCAGGAWAHGGGGMGGMGAMGGMGGMPCASGSPAATCQPGQAGPRAGDTRVTQTRLDATQAALNLAPAQQTAWNDYAKRVLGAVALRDQMHSAHPAAGDTEAIADFRVAMMRARAESLSAINTARRTLVASLTAEQRAVFERESTGPGAGPGAQRHDHAPRGPGMGPGPRAGGGHGAGRGCAMT